MSRITVSALVTAASKITRVPEAIIKGDGREKHVVHIRWAIMVAARAQGYSTPFIGRVLGNRDHSTILYGLGQSPELARRDPSHGVLISRINALAARMSAVDRHNIRVTFSCFGEAL